jgi:16S rRNA (adenine1518-N6/adenine1519-N6)-dimethyltransferase
MKDLPRTDRRSSSIPLQKRFGQHHLIDGAICSPLVDFLEPENRWVVEIGPGGGVLTQRLVAAGSRVLAVEIDIPWAMALSQELDSARTQVVIGDATEISWRHYPRGTLVTGNLPFNVSTVLIERLLPQWQTVPRAAFLVQREVGDRLVARPGEDAYGGLSVVTAARARVSKLGRVSRGSFRPPPKVDGVFIGLELIEPPLGEERMAGFNSTVRLSFSQRRKQLRNSLASGWGRPVAMQALSDAGIDPRSRAEELSLEEFVELHTAYRAVVPQ